MSKWMRIVSGLQYAGGVLVLLGALFVGCNAGRFSLRSGASKTMMLVSAVTMLLYSVLLLLGATWLRRAAVHFYDGVLSDNESPLAKGFRQLRLYLILYAAFALLGLVGAVVRLALGG